MHEVGKAMRELGCVCLCTDCQYASEVEGKPQARFCNYYNEYVAWNGACRHGELDFFKCD